jgi:hypothetical protein
MPIEAAGSGDGRIHAFAIVGRGYENHAFGRREGVNEREQPIHHAEYVSVNGLISIIKTIHLIEEEYGWTACLSLLGDGIERLQSIALMPGFLNV